MAIDVKEVSSVWVLKDQKFSTYDQGEKLLHEATWGFYTSCESARRAATLLEEKYPELPRGNWLVYDEIVYE